MKTVLLKQESTKFDAPKARVLPYDVDEKNLVDGYCRGIECKALDIIPITIANKVYSAVVDGEILMSENPIPTLYVDDGLVLFGNVLLAKEGGIFQEDAREILEYLRIQDAKLLSWLSENDEPMFKKRRLAG